MSHWSTITGTLTIEVFTGQTQPEINYILQSVLQSLPDVNPSLHTKPIPYPLEAHFDIFLNNPSLNRSSCTHDDNLIYAGHSSYNLENKNRFVPNYNKYQNSAKMIETCTTYILTVNGLFRDAFFENTLKDFTKWLLRLSRKIYVNDMCIKIEGDRLNNHNDHVVYVMTDKRHEFGDRYKGNEFEEILLGASRDRLIKNSGVKC